MDFGPGPAGLSLFALEHAQIGLVARRVRGEQPYTNSRTSRLATAMALPRRPVPVLRDRFFPVTG